MRFDQVLCGKMSLSMQITILNLGSTLFKPSVFGVGESRLSQRDSRSGIEACVGNRTSTDNW